MKQALSHLFNDLLSALLFLAVYLTTANITAAAAVAITVGLTQIVVQRFTGSRIWPMQWISLLVVIVLSAASIATQSPPLRHAEAEPRTFRDRRGDAETRLDEPLSARDRATVPARQCAGRPGRG